MSFPFKTTPFAHQREVFDRTRELEAYGLFWEMGCGKTKPTLDTVAHLYLEGEINGVLIVAPNNVHRNWIEEEIPIHLPEEVASETEMVFMQAGKLGAKRHGAEVNRVVRNQDGLSILAVNFEAFSSERAKNVVWQFLKPRKGRVLYVVDEAHRIKTPSAKRTRSIIASAKYAQYRRVLTGTPIANRPFDAYSQIRFLDDRFWARHRLPKFSIFKKRYGVWETGFNGRTNRSYETLVAYDRLEELNELLGSISHRLLKEDVLDLPPKSYKRLKFGLSREHRAAYDELREQCILLLESGDEVTTTMALTKLLRLQQVACGYVGTDEGRLERLPGKNVRLATLLDLLEDVPHKALVWARFTQDIDQICEKLGDRAVRYDGSVPQDQRAANKDRFQNGDAQFFVGNAAAGGTGLTLHAARTVVYYSNSFNLVERLQSEDRAHRIGQEHPVQYYDLIAEDTVDEHVVDSLVQKLDVAAKVTGDRLREWIR